MSYNFEPSKLGLIPSNPINNQVEYLDGRIAKTTNPVPANERLNILFEGATTLSSEIGLFNNLYPVATGAHVLGKPYEHILKTSVIGISDSAHFHEDDEKMISIAVRGRVSSSLSANKRWTPSDVVFVILPTLEEMKDSFVNSQYLQKYKPSATPKFCLPLNLNERDANAFSNTSLQNYLRNNAVTKNNGAYISVQKIQNVLPKSTHASQYRLNAFDDLDQFNSNPFLGLCVYYQKTVIKNSISFLHKMAAVENNLQKDGLNHIPSDKAEFDNLLEKFNNSHEDFESLKNVLQLPSKFRDFFVFNEEIFRNLMNFHEAMGVCERYIKGKKLGIVTGAHVQCGYTTNLLLDIKNF